MCDFWPTDRQISCCSAAWGCESLPEQAYTVQLRRSLHPNLSGVGPSQSAASKSRGDKRQRCLGAYRPRHTGRYSLLNETQARADWRAVSRAVLLGSAVGLALGGAYLAGGMARSATDHTRATRLASAATEGFSEAVLWRTAAAMDPGVMRLAKPFDGQGPARASEQDRKMAILEASLLRHEPDSGAMSMPRVLRVSYTAPAAPFRLVGALESSRELDCLTQAVYYEARGEPASGQAAVAQVVLNRLRSPIFPKTVCSVVFQGAARSTGCQFSFACDGSLRRRREPAAWRRAQEVAANALSGVVMAAVGNATHYHNLTVSPNWGPSLLRVTQVGSHLFYRPTYKMIGGYLGELPNMNAQPLTPEAEAPDLRMASMVLVEGPTKSGIGGPVSGGPEPASAPTEAKTASTEPQKGRSETALPVASSN